MKTKLNLLTYVFFSLFISIAISSCVGPEGPQGEQGEQGESGNDGTDGSDGTDCWDLNGNGENDPEEDTNEDGEWNAADCNGTDGANCWDLDNDGEMDPEEDINEDGEWNAADCAGEDGEDGNANVNTYIFNNPSWDNGYMDLNLEALTQEVIDTYQVLAYLGYEVDGEPNAAYYYVPGLQTSAEYYVRSWMNVGVYHMQAQVWDDVTQGYITYLTPDEVTSAKIILAAPSSTSEIDGNGRINPNYNIVDEMTNAGVDVTNYYEVCNYLGLQP
jgi:hypothetical protein